MIIIDRLDKLPTSVLWDIFSELHPDDLYQVSKVCKRFFAITQFPNFIGYTISRPIQLKKRGISFEQGCQLAKIGGLATKSLKMKGYNNLGNHCEKEQALLKETIQKCPNIQHIDLTINDTFVRLGKRGHLLDHITPLKRLKCVKLDEFTAKDDIAIDIEQAKEFMEVTDNKDDLKPNDSFNKIVNHPFAKKLTSIMYDELFCKTYDYNADIDERYVYLTTCSNAIFPNLRKLDLASYIVLGPENILAYEYSEIFSRIQSLKLSVRYDAFEALIHLLKSGTLSHLTSFKLDTRDCLRNRCHEVLDAVCKYCPNLTSLDIHAKFYIPGQLCLTKWPKNLNKLTLQKDRGLARRRLKAWAKQGGIPTLKTLRIMECTLSDVGIMHLGLAFPNLNTLVLKDCFNLSNKTLETIGNQNYFPLLKYLDVTDKGYSPRYRGPFRHTRISREGIQGLKIKRPYVEIQDSNWQKLPRKKQKEYCDDSDSAPLSRSDVE